MKRIIALLVVLVITSYITKTKTFVPKYVTVSKTVEGIHVKLNPKLNPNWEYVKDRLFEGNGESDYAYKINYRNKNYPILISTQDATSQDSIVVNEIITKLKTLIPNRKFLFIKDYIEKTYPEASKEWENFKRKNGKIGYNTNEPLFKGLSYTDLSLTTIQLSFSDDKNKAQLFDPIATNLANGNRIERENQFRRHRLTSSVDKVWFQFNDSLSYEKRKQYIQYEVLRTLCYIHPKTERDSFQFMDYGVFSTSDFKPETTLYISEQDKFLLKKLYEDDFKTQFKNYLTTSYSWLYATNFLNKDFSKIIFWSITICLVLFAFVLLFSLHQSKKIKNSYLNYFIPVFFIISYILNFSSLYQYLVEIQTYGIEPTPLQNIIEGYFFFTAIALIGSFLLWVADKFWIDKTQNFLIKLALKVVFTFFVFNIPTIVLLFMGAYNSEGFLEILIITLVLTFIIALGRGLLIYLNHFSENLIKQKDVELSQLKEINSQAEVKLLQSQINPHFLYNALNSIASLAHKNADKTEKMALSLSDLFKYTINRKGKKDSTIGDEVEMVQNYLEVEQIRFDDRLHFTIDVDKSLENTKIPMFLIQPLIENAVKHGISKVEKNGQITLCIQKTETGFIIVVEDNGPDFPDGLVSGYGLQTVFDLLRLTYKDKAAISWKNTPTKHIKINIENEH
ncbi:sensor histidine kinase [Polaribacter ponticola]|uniref:Histidine kinase n=1 Tax=Polaribacter ponticola TaxID=2978475 RepID=A0ABT5SB03_9FLAO|nr:histidine kinase [Polaribacter sp. MSW5]MDD7915298.1 histidine kinase [Polaribacter sp. MSW5]